MRIGSDTVSAASALRTPERPNPAARAMENAGSPAGSPVPPSGKPPSRSKTPSGPGASGPAGKSSGKSGKPPKRRPLIVRMLLWMLRKSIVPILCVVALIGGLYAGYVVLGKGPEQDVWEWATWKHMWDLIFAE